MVVPTYGIVIEDGKFYSAFHTDANPDIDDHGCLANDNVFWGDGWEVKIVHYKGMGDVVQVVHSEDCTTEKGAAEDTEDISVKRWLYKGYFPLRDGLLLLGTAYDDEPIKFIPDDEENTGAIYEFTPMELYKQNFRQLGITAFEHTTELQEAYSLPWHPGRNACSVLVSDGAVEWEDLGNDCIHYKVADPHWVVVADRSFDGAQDSYSVTLTADLSSGVNLFNDLRAYLQKHSISNFCELFDLWPAMVTSPKIVIKQPKTDPTIKS